MMLSSRKKSIKWNVSKFKDDWKPWILTKDWNQERLKISYRLKISLWQSRALGCLAPRWSSKPRGRCQNFLSFAGESMWQEVAQLLGTVFWVTTKCTPVKQLPVPVWEKPSALGCHTLLSLTVILSWCLQHCSGFLSEYVWKPVIIAIFFFKRRQKTTQ